MAFFVRSDEKKGIAGLTKSGFCQPQALGRSRIRPFTWLRRIPFVTSTTTTTITVRPFQGMWEMYELPGIQPLFSTRQRAIRSALHLLKGRPGVIQVHGTD